MQDRTAIVLDAQGDNAGAMKLVEPGLERARALLAAHPGDLETANVAASIYFGGSSILENTNLAKGMGYLSRALEILAPYGKKHPENLELVRRVAAFRCRLESVQVYVGKLGESLVTFQGCAADRAALLAKEPDNALFLHDLMIAYGNMGAVQGSPMSANLGDTAGAIAAFGSD